MSAICQIIFIMGVTGSGKTTVGKLLAERISLPFFDGDDYHSPANIEKMKSGIALTDADRWNWLKKLNQVAGQQQTEKGAVIACSALKQSYRDLLQNNIIEPCWFFLEGSPDLLQKRLQKRKGHFMPLGLLPSQFETLETPVSAIPVSIENDPGAIVKIIMDHLNRKSPGTGSV